MHKYFSQNTPKFIQKLKKKPKKKKGESLIKLPTKLEDQIDFKRKYPESFPDRYDAGYVE